MPFKTAKHTPFSCVFQLPTLLAIQSLNKSIHSLSVCADLQVGKNMKTHSASLKPERRSKAGDHYPFIVWQGSLERTASENGKRGTDELLPRLSSWNVCWRLETRESRKWKSWKTVSFVCRKILSIKGTVWKKYSRNTVCTEKKNHEMICWDTVIHCTVKKIKLT